MVTDNVSDSTKTAKKPATVGELASQGSFGANLIANPGQKPNYRPPHASGGTGGELAIESDAPKTDREPPNSRELPPPLSAMAVRLTDGAIFVSLEDAHGRNLTGRTIVAFLLLTDDEILLARSCLVESHDEIAAQIIGGLPK